MLSLNKNIHFSLKKVDIHVNSLAMVYSIALSDGDTQINL